MNAKVRFNVKKNPFEQIDVSLMPDQAGRTIPKYLGELLARKTELSGASNTTINSTIEASVLVDEKSDKVFALQTGDRAFLIADTFAKLPNIWPGIILSFLAVALCFTSVAVLNMIVLFFISLLWGVALYQTEKTVVENTQAKVPPKPLKTIIISQLLNPISLSGTVLGILATATAALFTLTQTPLIQNLPNPALAAAMMASSAASTLLLALVLMASVCFIWYFRLLRRLTRALNDHQGPGRIKKGAAIPGLLMAVPMTFCFIWLPLSATELAQIGRLCLPLAIAYISGFLGLWVLAKDIKSVLKDDDIDIMQPIPSEESKPLPEEDLQIADDSPVAFLEESKHSIDLTKGDSIKTSSEVADDELTS